MDFNTQAWYQAYVSHEIRRQSDNALLASGETYSIPGTNSLASRTSRTPGVPNITYRLDSKHWIFPLATGQCVFSRWDRYQFTNIGPPFIGGNYGATQTFAGFAGTGVLCVQGWIYLGQTTQSKTVPSVTITNPRIGSVPAPSTQTALLGADIVLGSTVTPTGGSYSWTFTGPYSISGGGTSSSSVTVRSSDVGTITAKLTYTANGIQVAPQFTINVVIPTLQSFTGQLGSALVDPGKNDCGYNDGFWRFKLGCKPLIPGMHFTTTVHAPNFISDPSQSGIKYVQAVSAYRKQVKGGNLLCSTRRSSPTDVASGWQLDTEDPYVFEDYPVHTFSEGNDLTMLTVDYPNQALTFIALWEHVDALEVDDRFQMYVVYFTFNPQAPPISRPLGKLEWNFGGLVVFDKPGSHQIRSNYVTPGNLTGQTTTSMVTMQGNVQENSPLSCPGAPPITFNRIDATQYFVRQHYLDFLGREPDLDGWNWWTSEITECAFDLNCIHTERLHIGMAFILEANSVKQDPDMANPPGTAGFSPAIYNRAFIRHCYLNYLLREPDPEGWDHWTNDLNSDGNYWHIIEAFQAAPRYRERFCPTC